MSVKLRKKTLSNGKISLYLDIYIDGQRKYEFLKFHLYKKTRTPFEAEHNKETLALAQGIAAKRQIALQAGTYNLSPSFKRNINFLEYYEGWVKNYTNKDVRIAKYSLEHFKKFIQVKGYKDFISPKDITEDLCIQFKSHLDDNLNGETPYNYFTKFKKLLKEAIKRDKIFIENPAEDIKNKKKDGLKKDILNFSEIQKLAQTPCYNNEVKRAFLFSLNTGLRWCDVTALKWRQIDGDKIKLTQKKTKGEAIVDLNSTSMKILGQKESADTKVFNLPSHTGCLKSLEKWTLSAGIDKNITWHSARHSFAVNLLWMKNDIKSVSSLLGHSGLKHTEKYTRVVDELKKNAVNSLPNIDL